jgi:Tfp pilus assembly protein PilF
MLSQRPLDIPALLRAAIACVDEGNLDHAAVNLKALLEIDGHSEVANGMMAAIYAELKMPALAADYYASVLRINPQNALARFQLGLLQLQTNEPEKALATLHDSLDNPDDFLAHFHSALALLQLHRADEARPLLEAAAARMPRDHLLRSSLQDLLLTP